MLNVIKQHNLSIKLRNVTFLKYVQTVFQRITNEEFPMGNEQLSDAPNRFGQLVYRFAMPKDDSANSFEANNLYIFQFVNKLNTEERASFQSFLADQQTEDTIAITKYMLVQRD